MALWNNTGYRYKPRKEIFSYMSSTRNYAISTDNGSTYVSAGYKYIENKTTLVRSAWQAYAPPLGMNGSQLYEPLNYIGAVRGINYAGESRPVVLYAELRPVSELTRPYTKELFHKPNSAFGSVQFELRDTGDISDWFYIRNIAFYYNDDNGNYDEFNPRQPYNGVLDIVCPVNVSQAWYWLNGAKQNVFGDSNNVTTIRFCYNFYHSANAPQTYYPVSGPSVPHHPYFTRNAAQGDLTILGRTIVNYNDESEQYLAMNGALYTIVKSKEDFKTYCDIFGVPVFFDLNDVEYTNTPIIGQPDNPNPEDTPEGTGDNTSDVVVIPTVINPSTHFYNQLWVDFANVTNFKRYLFTETFLNDIRRLWNEPAECVVSVVAYPFDVGVVHNLPYDISGETGRNRLSIGNIGDVESVTGYGVKPILQDGTLYIDMGSYELEPYFGSYLDYDGYTSISIYLPYIGERQLDTSEVMGKSLHLIYYPDFVANTFMAILYANGQPIANYTGVLGTSIPLSGTDYNQFAKDIASGVVNTVISIASTGVSAKTGNAQGAASGAIGAVGTALNTATTQTHTKQVGALTPNTGIYGAQIPYLIINRPYTSQPEDWNALHGTAAGYSATVGECTGYVEVSDVQLVANDIMTPEEQNEIESLLKGGIYI